MPYYTNVLEPLIWVSADMDPQPWLAKSWERTGEQTFEFTLRDDITFHNGDPLTADEVVWSFQQIFNEWAWAPGWLHTNPDGVIALDDVTVEFTLTGVYPTFPGLIAHNMVAIQHPDRDRENMQPIGTGPYQVEAVEKGQRVETSAFEDYWRGPAKTPHLTFRVITDANTRALALSGHNVDVAFAPPRNKLESLRDSDKTGVTTQLTPASGWVEINMETSPTDDLDLRKGLNYAVSQEAIVDSVLSGVGVPARGMIASNISWSAHEMLPEYGPNKETAKSLIKQSTYAGETLQFIVQTGDPVGGDLMAQVIQQSASEIGVDIEIKVIEGSAFNDAVLNKNGHFFLISGGSNSASANYLLSDAPTLYNLDYYGEQFDSLIAKGNRATEQATREQAYIEAQKIMLEKAGIIPLYYEEYVVGHYQDVQGLDLRPIAEMSRWTGLEHLGRGE